jgi:starch-binding outer membrane protein, SusD/RagB family
MQRRIYFIIFISAMLFTVSCKKEKLNLINPNLPTPAASLTTEEGLKNFALGLVIKPLANIPGEGTTNIMVVAMTNHYVLGDEQFGPYGNWAIRWVNQPDKITLPDARVIRNPNGLTQLQQLQGFNSRQAGERNAFQYEWGWCYYYISQCNTLLKAIENPDVRFSGDAAVKKATLKAWALWWKGYSYSRIGSIYLSGIINDEPGTGVTNGNFAGRDAIIAEGNKILDECTGVLNGLTQNADYDEVMTAVVPTFSDNQKIISPAMWKRQISSYKARNLLANKKVKDMAAADWNQVLTLCNQGLQSADNVFVHGMREDGINDVNYPVGWHPVVNLGTFSEFLFVSERLIQDFKTGDKRLDKNFYLNPAPYPANIRGRGLQFGTRWAVNNIEDGGGFATNNNLGKIFIACTYEENELMKAEALIQTNQVEQGLQIIDAVRNYQGAGLAAVAGTGLNKTQALEELRRERRVGLFLRGTAFYDARRWGITAPAAQGGGRANAWVYLPAGTLSNANDQVFPCFIDYNYVDYWDIPQNELDFNVPASGSAPVKN